MESALTELPVSCIQLLYTCDYRLRSVLCRRSAGAVRWEEASSQRHFLEEVRLDGDVKGVCVFDLRY